MPWSNVTNSQVQLTRNMPSSGCFHSGYVNWKVAFQCTLSLERWVEAGASRSSPVQLTFDPTSQTREQFAAQVSLALTDDLSTGFELNQARGQALVQSVRGNSSPRAFGNALLNCLSIKQKLNIAGREYTVGVGADTDLCFFSVQVPLPQWHPEFPRFDLMGETVRVRYNLQGNATFKFGLSEQGWRWLAQHAGRQAVMALIRRLTGFVGQQVIPRLVAFLGTTAGVAAVSIAGGLAGGALLAYLTSEFIASAQRAGRNHAWCGQYAEGYVQALWTQFGTPSEGPQIAAAYGPMRQGTMGNQVRQAGADAAFAHIERIGGGVINLQAAVEVRRQVLAMLRDANIPNISSITPQSAFSRALVGGLARYLEYHTG